MGQPGMVLEVASLPVHRDEPARSHEGEHQPQLLLRGVAGCVHRIGRHVEHVGPGPVEGVHHAMDRGLVPWDQGGGQDDGLSGPDVDELVLALRHERERGVRLTLRTGADHDDAARIQPVDLLDVDDVLLRHVEEFQSPGGIDRLVHRPPEERHHALIGVRGVHDLLDPVDVAREAGRDHQARSAGDDVVQDGSHGALADGVPGFLGVRGIGEEEMHALAASGLLGQPVEVGRPSVQGCLIDLEVARVHDRPERGVDDDRHPVGDGVRDPEEPHGERSGRGLLPRGHGLQVDEMRHLVLVELALQQRERERGAVDLEPAIDVAQEVRERPDVVFVTVGEDDPLDLVRLLAHEVEVRQDEIDTGHVARRERQPDVDDQDPVVELEAGHVPTDLTHPSEEDESRGRSRGDRHPPVLCEPDRARPRWRGRVAGGADPPAGPACPEPPSPGSGSTSRTAR